MPPGKQLSARGKGFQRKPKQVRAISEHGFTGPGGAFGLGETYAPYGLASQADAKRDFGAIPATISFMKGIGAIYEIEWRVPLGRRGQRR